MKRILSILTILIALLVLVSCTNDISDPAKSGEPSTWEDVFLTFWNTMNTEYVHFENEPDMDWDGVYSKYLTLFENLDFTDRAFSLKAFTYFKEIVLRIQCDNHYNLRIYDNFGSYLDISPAKELKWSESTGGDVYEYPDVYWVQSNKTSIMCIKGGKTIIDSWTKWSDASDAEKRTLLGYWNGVEGYSEVSELLSVSTTLGGDVTYGVFHNSNGVASDFAQGYVGAAFSTDEATLKSYYTDNQTTVTSAAVSAITDPDAAEFWESLVSTYDLEGFTYFYGLTDDGIFYFYLSSFPSADVLALETILNPITDAEVYHSLSKDMKVMYNKIWKGPNRYYEKLKVQIKQLKGICSLAYNLRLIGSMNECILADSDICTVNGVVMDVRSNGGGKLNFLFSLMGSFFRNETQIGYLRYKDGYSRYEYTPWAEYSLPESCCNPLADGAYQNPFYIIVNGQSASCSETAALLVKQLPKGKVLGTTTFGAIGAIGEREVYHSGKFESKYVSIYTSSFEMVGKDKEKYEGVGVTPDQEVKSGDNSKDTRYETAMTEIKKAIAASSSGS